MIKRFLATLAAIVVAYGLASVIAPRLPEIRLIQRSLRPATLAEAIGGYVLHDQREELHLLSSPRPATWDDVNGSFQLYELANAVPSEGDVYSGTGGDVESLYETFLLSIKVGGDTELVNRQDRYRQARSREDASWIGEGERRRRQRLTEKSLKDLVSYVSLSNPMVGPAPMAVGKAVRDFYAIPKPKIRLADGEEKNFRPISTRPALSLVRNNSIIVESVDVIVANDVEGRDARPGKVGHIKSMRLAEIELVRPWLDSALLSRTNGPWIGDDPKLFGSSGVFQRLPVRLVIAQRPQVITDSATVVKGSAGSLVKFGPFDYAPSSIDKKDGKIELQGKSNEWIVLGVISKRL